MHPISIQRNLIGQSFWRVSWLLGLALLLSAHLPTCAQDTANPSETANPLLKLFQQIGAAIPQAPAAPGAPLPAVGQPGMGQSGAAGVILQNILPSPNAVPIRSNFKVLFDKGLVNGEDLYSVLTAMRQEILEQRNTKAFVKLQMASTSLSQGLFQGGSATDVAVDVAMKALQQIISNYAISTAMQQLDQHLNTLLGDRRSAMAAETIQLPSAVGMDDAMAKRVLSMAAMIVSARVTVKMLDQAEADFKSLRTDYAALLDQREKAAEALMSVIDHRRAAIQGQPADKDTDRLALVTALGEKRVQFIDEQLSSMTLKDFIHDMEAQNTALDYLSKARPGEYQDYRTKADDVVRRTLAYSRTMSGILAFGSLSVNFAKSLLEIGAEKNIANLLTAMPLGAQYLQAAVPVAKKAVESAWRGVTLPFEESCFLLCRSKPLFTLHRPNTPAQTVGTTADLISELNKTPDVADRFAKDLFDGQGAGWLKRVQDCDPADTGRLIDTAANTEARKKFATDYLGYDNDKASEFSFVNSFSAPVDKRERDMREKILMADQRVYAGLGQAPIGELQKAVAANLGAWSDDQMLRLIFHAREIKMGSASTATLEFNEVRIRPIPSPAAVFAYEARAESCRSANDKELAPLKPVKVAAVAAVVASAASAASKSASGSGKGTKPGAAKPPAARASGTSSKAKTN